MIHLFPNANIPVIQLSIPKNLLYQQYYKIGEQFVSLSKEGFLIIASGNITHNLKDSSWNENLKSHLYATEFDNFVKQLVLKQDMESLFNIEKNHPELFKKSHPSDDHFIPLFYALGAAKILDSPNRISFPCSFIQNSSISMTSIIFQAV